jgi:hypothetical protein
MLAWIKRLFGGLSGASGTDSVRPSRGGGATTGTPTRTGFVRPAGGRPPVQAGAGADSFEDVLLEWLRTRVGVKPVQCQGTNSQFWRFEFNQHMVDLVVIGPGKNTSTPPAPGTDWIVRVQEQEPLEFVRLLESSFAPGNRLERRMGGGRIRVQFKSSELLPGSELAAR